MDLNCTNILFIGGINDKNEMEKILSLVEEKLNCFYVDENIGWMEIGFTSEKEFPESEMYEIAKEIYTPDIKLGVISYAFYENYVAYHSYKNDNWSQQVKTKILQS